MPDLDPLTGKDPSSLSVQQLAERLAMERALREQATGYERELRAQATASGNTLAAALASSHTEVHRAESRARDKAEQSIDKRLEGMNEFRDQLRTQAATFLTIAAFDAHWGDLQTQLGAIHTGIIELQKKDLGTEERRAGQIRGQGMIVAAIVGSISVGAVIVGLIISVASALQA